MCGADSGLGRGHIHDSCERVTEGKMKKLLLFLLLTAGLAMSQVTVAPFITSAPQFFDDSGKVLAGGKVCFFAAGTSNPLATYSESTGTTANSNPLILTAAGRPASAIYMTSASYKIVVAASTADNTCTPAIKTSDNVSWANFSQTVTSLTSNGAVQVIPSTAATSGANQSSPNLQSCGNIWNGSASVSDCWTLQTVDGTGSNPSSTFTLTHSGSSGTATFSIPSAAVSLGGNVSVGAVTASTSATSPAFISSTANPASAGIVRLANADAIKWRNNANGGDVALQKTGAASGNLPADTLDATAFGGVESAAFISNSASPAAAGKIRLASTDTIAWRNNAGVSDVTIAKTGAVSGSVAADTLNLASFGGILLAGPIWGANSIAVDSTHPITIPAATDTMALLALPQTFTSKTLTAPVINGTPTGTGIPTITLKKGSGAGLYTSTSLTYVQVDGTNLTYTVTIPTGWKLLINAAFRAGTNTAAVAHNIGLADGGTIIVETNPTLATANTANPGSLAWVVNGDGASHTIDLRFKTSNAADAVIMGNQTGTDLPTMTFLLTPSN